MGWDNFSTSLDLGVNIPRTVFATWREYRGFGGTSDSEVVDLFRQGAQLLLSLVLPKPFLEQATYLLQFCIGALGMFFLAKAIVARYHKHTASDLIQFAGLLASMMYVSNTFCFETFYFPIAMYVLRFAFLPWIIFFFLRVLYRQIISKKEYLFLLVTILGLSGSYLTATVFFTVLICLGCIAAFHLRQLGRIVLFMTAFLLLNAFWLVPFGHYYLTRSSLLPQASAFVEVNESLLNKPAETMSWRKLLTFYPETLTTQSLPFRALSSGQPWSAHPLLEKIELDSDPTLSFALLLPALLSAVGVGSLLRFSYSRRTLEPLWIVSLGLMILFFLRKELPPLGFLFDLMGQYIPYFKVVLRFGSAKFSPYLLVSLCLLAALGATTILHTVNQSKKRLNVVLLIPILSLLVMVMYPSTFYLRGELFSPLVRVNVPTAYWQLANELNSTSSYGRVLHLPIDQFSYWKSYSWGYFGSSFFHFMIDRPLIDRTFEPANIELDYFLQSLQKTTMSIATQQGSDRQQRVQEFYQLLKKTGTAYIVFDESVSRKIVASGVEAWGVFHTEEYAEMLKVLREQRLISLVSERRITSPRSSQGDATLFLYKVEAVDDVVRSVAQVTNVDPAIDNTFISPLLGESDWIQSAAHPSVSFPFWQPKHMLRANQGGFTLRYPYQKGKTNQLDWSFVPDSAAENGQRAYALFLEKASSGVELVVVSHTPLTPIDRTADAVRVQLPAQIYDQSDEQEDANISLNNAHVLHDKVLSRSRLKIDGQVFFLPAELKSGMNPLGTVLTAKSALSIDVLQKAQEDTDLLSKLITTTDPNCYRDRKAGYIFSIDRENGNLHLTTQNGMTCVTTGLVKREELAKTVDADTAATSTQRSNTDHYELLISTIGSRVLNDGQVIAAETSLSDVGKQVRRSVTGLQEIAGISVCLLEPRTGQCLNSRQDVHDFTRRTARIITDKSLPFEQLQLLIVLPSIEQTTTEVTLSDVRLDTFTTTPLEDVQLPGPTQTAQQLSFEGNDVVLPIPYVLSSGSYYWNTAAENLKSYTHACEKKNGFRATKSLQALPALAYVENCSQGLFKNLTLQPNNMYLWSVDYSLLSGKFPKFLATHTKEFKNEYLSRFNGYPTIPGFKTLQVADLPWWSSGDRQSYVEDKLATARTATADTILSSQEFGSELVTARLEVAQNAENQGVFGLSAFQLTALPKSWQNLAISNGDSTVLFNTLKIFQVERLLPSAWRVQLQSQTRNGANPYLLQFGQAYDAGWQLFEVRDVLGIPLPGKKIAATHIKMNGWSNAWQLPQTSFVKDQPKTIYIIFVPELGAVVGWGVTAATIVTIAGLVLILRRRRRQASTHTTQRVRHRFKHLRDVFTVRSVR